ncbi:hypothetical protein DOK67_0002570 [Enterococcus sp. DIV0212c]|uniref:hypothetical protein n=1 Tax=Enterococcus sp. DIV0212c TaxID=2230867 RepID=UPI001A9B4797|nr:hypothetical protein [Enterococcus sp. DIV0212c]MBO1353500.1 hypothetical protein [Enterococcus sp. DIV0212c]
MSEFDFWDDKFDHFFSSATPSESGKFNFNILKNRIIVIHGEKNSGKSTVAEKLIDSYRKDKQIEEITKIYGSNTQYLILSKNGKPEETFLSNRISTGINKIDVTLSVWEKFLQYKNKRKKYIIWIDNFEKINEINSCHFFQLISENPNILPIITTSDKNLANTIIENMNKRNPITIEIPKISFSDFQNYKKKSRKLGNESAIFELLRHRNDEEVRLFIDMTKGVYGTLYHLLSLFKDGATISEEQKSMEYILNQIFYTTDKSLVDTNRLILYFYMFDQYINFDILEKFYVDSSFDYISVLEKLEMKNILKSDGVNFKLSPEICALGDEFIENYSNKRLRRNTSFLIDHLIRETHSEDYLFRAENAKYYSKNLSETYLFLNTLRNNDQNSVELSKYHNDLLKILNTELGTSDELSDKENDLIITKRITNLKSTYSRRLHLLEKAEYHYYYTFLLLAYSYENRVDRFPKLKLELRTLLDIYKKLKVEKETEMQVKIGLLLSTQLVNVLNKEFLKEAIKIYDDLQLILDEKKYQENGFYDAYAIKMRLFSSCLLPPEESYEELENLLLEIKNKSSSYAINENDLVALTITNLLGVSFYLTKETLSISLKNFEKNEQCIYNFSEKRYKLDNNIYLAKYILCNSPTKSFIKKSIKNFLNVKNESHIIKINLAGLYFYLSEFNNAKKLLTKVLSEEPNDDFYIYFCQYNLKLIQLFSEPTSKSKKNNYLEELKSLKIPTLFQTKYIQNAFEKKSKYIINYLNKNEGNYSIKDIESELSNIFGEQTPILQKLWQFSDYQYWS